MTTPIPSPPAVPFIGHVTTLDRDVPIKSMDLLAKQYGEIYQLSIFGEPRRPKLSPPYLPLDTERSFRPGEKRIFISSYNLVNEVSDEKRFRKKISAGLKQVRNAAGDGLFTVCAFVSFGLRNSHSCPRHMFQKSRTGGSLVSPMASLFPTCLRPSSHMCPRPPPYALLWDCKHLQHVRRYDRHRLPARTEVGTVRVPYHCDLRLLRLNSCRSSFGAREMIDPASDFTRLTLDAICLCAMSYRYAAFTSGFNIPY